MVKRPRESQSDVKTNCHEVSRKTGCSRENVEKWHRAAGMDYSDLKASLALCMEHKKGPKPAGNVDPKTGLTWPIAFAKERTLELRRLNAVADREKDEAWVRTEEHLKVLSLLCGRLEQLPGKAKSELGLTEAQRDGLQKMLDQSRHEAAGELEK